MKTHTYSAVAAFIFLAPLAAHAGMDDCEELKEPAIMAQRDACIAHAACEFVLSTQSNCSNARRFIDRLTGKHRAISANDVYEANLPDVDFPQEWQDRFAAVRERVLASGTDTQRGKNNDGRSWLYQGDVRDGKRQGWGIFFWSGGTMYRGQFSGDWRTGQGEYATQNGYRDVGAYENNDLNGEAWVRLANGSQKKGTFSKGNAEGFGTYLFTSGNLYSGPFRNGAFNGLGTIRWANGSSFEGNFTDGKPDGQGTYTSTSGEKFSRTYAAGHVVAGHGAPQTPAASVQPTMTAAVSPRQAAMDRITQNYDQRIATAREQCTSEDNSCQKGCAAVSVVSLLSVFGGNREGAGAASDQIQQCSDRCDLAKRSCSQQVSALERGKSQAIANAGSDTRNDENRGGNLPAPVNPAIACNDSYKTCSTACGVGGALGALISGSRMDNAASLQCINECGSKQQQCLTGAAPAPGLAAVPGASGSYSASGAAGGTFSTTSVSVLDGVGAPSQFNCMKTEWISETVPTSNNVGEAYFSSKGPRDSTGRDPHLERKLLLATYVCEPDVIYFVATCHDKTMLSAGGGNQQWKERWTVGELSGVWATIATGRQMKKGQQLVLAESYVFRSSYSLPNHSTVNPVQVAMGVWQVDSLFLKGTSDRTEAKKKLDRRHGAMHLELNRILRGTANTYNLTFISGNSPAIFRKGSPGSKSCKTAAIQAVWDSTQ